MTLKIYGIPNCGTCKKALQWLDSQGICYEFINTRENPPHREEIEAWVQVLTAKAMRNTSGRSYRELGTEKQTWTEEDWIAAFSRDAMLIKRPLMVKNGRAILVGFKVNVEDLLELLR